MGRHTVSVSSAGTFAAAGTRYKFNPDTGKMVAFAPGDRRLSVEMTTSIQDWANKTTWDVNGGGSVDIQPLGSDSTYIYGMSTADNSLLYRLDLDAEEATLVWDHASTTFRTDGIHKITLADGTERLLIFLANGGISYSDDFIATTPTAATVSDTVLAAPWATGGLTQIPDTPYAFFGTYSGDANETDQIFQTDDYGVNWYQRATRTDTADGTNLHAHTSWYDPTTETCYVDWGDSVANQATYVSTDNGETWANYSGSKISQTQQVIDAKPQGDGTVLFSSDGSNQIFLADMTTWNVGRVNRQIFKTKQANQYFASVDQVGGLYYAAGFTDGGASGTQDQGIWVSQDLYGPWVMYYRTADHDQRGLRRYLGFHANKLWYEYDNASSQKRLGCISPARIFYRSGLKLDPARTNLLPATTADCSNLAGYATPGSGTKTAVTGDDALITSSIRFTRPVSAGGSCSATVTPGFAGIASNTNYVFKAWVKVNKGKYLTMSFNGTSPNLPCPPLGEWGIVQAVIDTGVVGGTIFPVVACQAHELEADRDFEVGATSLYLAEGTGHVAETDEWEVGGAATVGETFKWTQTLPTDWTLVVDQRTFPYSGSLEASTVYPVLTVKVDTGEFIQVYYDTTDSMFHFETTDGASPSASPLDSAEHYLTREFPLRLIIRYSGGVCRLSIRTPRGLEHLTGTLTRTGTALVGSCDIIMGADDGTITLPTVVSHMEWLDGALSDSEVEDWLEKSVVGIPAEGSPWDLSKEG